MNLRIAIVSFYVASVALYHAPSFFADHLDVLQLALASIFGFATMLITRGVSISLLFLIGLGQPVVVSIGLVLLQSVAPDEVKSMISSMVLMSILLAVSAAFGGYIGWTLFPKVVDDDRRTLSDLLDPIGVVGAKLHNLERVFLIANGILTAAIALLEVLG